MNTVHDINVFKGLHHMLLKKKKKKTNVHNLLKFTN